MKSKPQSLYIHIPFCDHICSYCDFTKLFYFEQYESPYLNTLFKEIDSYSIDKVNTIYVGGGTPTSLSDAGFESLLMKLKPLLNENGEFTVEANVENLSLKKLELMKEYGVTRISIGIQSSSNKRLKEIGRNHSYQDAKKAVEMAKNVGLSNINVDFIYGFEGETILDLENDLNNYIKLNVDHVSIYSLIIEPGSILFNKGKKEQNEVDSRAHYEFILNFLREHGYKRYEISNFARNNAYCLHNMTYWKNEEYYGCGLGASGYVSKVRYTNTKNLDTYISGNYCAEKEEISKETELEYFLITNLRMEDGFSRSTFKNKFGIDFVDKYYDKIKSFNLDKFFNITKESIALSDEGLLMMDFVVLKLL